MTEATPSGPEPLDLVFAALADPTRRSILRRLAEDGPATATQLAAALPVSRQAVSKHLAALSAAGLVQATPVGREVRHQCTPELLLDAVAWMAAVGGHGDRRLAALQAPVDRRKR